MRRGFISSSKTISISQAGTKCLTCVEWMNCYSSTVRWPFPAALKGHTLVKLIKDSSLKHLTLFTTIFYGERFLISIPIVA